MWRRMLCVCLLAAMPLLAQERDWSVLMAQVDGLCRQGDFAAVRTAISAALKDKETPDNLHMTGTLLWLLGSANNVLGDFDEADLRFRAAISALERAGAPAELTLAKAHLDYATLIELRGSTKAVERRRLFGLEILRRKLGEDHPEVLGALADLALGYHVRGDYARAEQLCREVIQAAQSSGRPPDTHTAETLVTLGWTLLASRRPREAAGHFRQSVAILESLFGPKSPMLLYSWEGLAVAQIRMREFESAAELLDRADRIAVAALGPANPMRLQVLTAQCELLRAEGKKAEAKKLEKTIRNLARDSGSRRHSVSFAELAQHSK